MKTIILQQPGQFGLTDTAEPGQPGPGEALVKVQRVGICGTDLHAFKGEQPFFSYPRILGHELGVEIVALGPESAATGLAIGDKCSVEPYLNCGRCLPCRQGKTNCCTSLRTLGVHTDGGMREWITVPAHKLHKSASLPLEHLALVEMLCIGAHAVRRAQIQPTETALVIGAGPIGMSVIQFAKLTAAKLIVMEVSPQRMEFCQRHFGVEHFVDGRQEPLAQLKEILGDDLPAIVFDATGSPASMKQAFNYVSHGGKLVFVGLFQGDVTFHDPHFHMRELTLLSSRNATATDFGWAIHMLEEGRINLTPWITHRASPESLAADFPGWLEPQTGVVKAMLEFG